MVDAASELATYKDAASKGSTTSSGGTIATSFQVKGSHDWTRKRSESLTSTQSGIALPSTGRENRED
jgi:hypothetical protein